MLEAFIAWAIQIPIIYLIVKKYYEGKYLDD